MCMCVGDDVITHGNAWMTLLRVCQVMMKAAAGADIGQRMRMCMLANAMTALAQGIPFFHAADEMLRSKSLDRDSYNSGDHFNRIDWYGCCNSVCACCYDSCGFAVVGAAPHNVSVQCSCQPCPAAAHGTAQDVHHQQLWGGLASGNQERVQLANHAAAAGRQEHAAEQRPHQAVQVVIIALWWLIVDGACLSAFCLPAFSQHHAAQQGSLFGDAALEVQLAAVSSAQCG